ncbi:hypothetical protein [uncultured Mediterranean phage uvMED]|nr:hypothetical protein [uncultured Mediterranean phage uvMED]
MGKVTITERRVYHKVSKIVVDIPDIMIRRNQVDDWLLDNEGKWEEQLDSQFEHETFEYGTGVDDYPHMNCDSADRETRYDVEGDERLKIVLGGHL